MANEFITTTITTLYRLDASDNLYIAPTGSIRFGTSSAPALANNLATDILLDIVIDGSVIGMSGPAITLASVSASTAGLDTITIGESGLVRSVSGIGISITRSNETVFNHGTIQGGSASFFGVFFNGNNNVLNNTGSISGFAALGMTGTGNVVTNSGVISGRTGMEMTGGNSTVSNTGSVNVVETTAVFQSGFASASLYNAGSIVTTRGTGVFASSTNTAAAYDLVNLGQIHGGSGFAFKAGFTTASGSIDTSLSVVNSGEMTGSQGGILIEGRIDFFSMRITNTVTGIISTPSKNAAIEYTGALRLINDGLITSNAAFTFDDATIQASGTGASLILVNRGTIVSHGEAIDMNGSQLTTGSLTLRNFGDIFGTVIGGLGNDLIVNRGTLSSIQLGSGNDVVRNFGVINGDLNFGDAVSLGDGNNLFDSRWGTAEGRVAGGSGNDTIVGGLGDDVFDGFLGDDILIGGSGNDVLEGGLGRDLIRGGEGNDTLHGDFDFDTTPGSASSADTLFGGTGEDIFVFQNPSYMGNTSATQDRIADFSASEDKIKLTAFMAGGVFIGTANFSATGTKEVRFAASVNLLVGDVNGDGTFDWILGVNPGLTFTADNFIF